MFSLPLPDGYDPGSTIIVDGFPSSFSVNDCKNFLSWFGPIIYIDKLTHPDGAFCYVVVFASPVHAEQMLKLKTIAIDSGNTKITVQTPQEMESIWNTVGDMFNNAGSVSLM
ncbi:conserved hypothetical protein [Theileria equi strain WA]|uniref:RRM domain-containing protein n=1 Tax=Theileria equi strain WA TaxID=1537102 RepID=L1LB51_THEEQ|nr:conserved hypothetical protein [Theileria equi strain WA]EKX72378.1 conserved hypothetical protein [Theileria equi strain WA]|eukprot:XP_004831830.1 conserved hypothetical protein [Theileria equi strain WA]